MPTGADSVEEAREEDTEDEAAPLQVPKADWQPYICQRMEADFCRPVVIPDLLGNMRPLYHTIRTDYSTDCFGISDCLRSVRTAPNQTEPLQLQKEAQTQRR